MREYASDAPDREYVYLVLAALSILAAWLLHIGMKAAGLNVLWWMEMPSVLGFYGIFFKLFDAHVWKAFSGLPDLNGTWVGEIESDFDEGVKKPCVIHINQSWSRLLAILQTDQSRSTSTMAALYVGASRERGLKYEFVSEPIALSPGTMHTHRGCCHFEISSDRRRLDGSYYTGRDRGNVGRLHLSFISRERLDYTNAISKAGK